VDNYLRMSWMYLLKDKTQIPDFIKKIYHGNKKGISTIIRVLHTDDAFEYIQKEVSHFCVSHGIL